MAHFAQQCGSANQISDVQAFIANGGAFGIEHRKFFKYHLPTQKEVVEATTREITERMIKCIGQDGKLQRAERLIADLAYNKHIPKKKN